MHDLIALTIEAVVDRIQFIIGATIIAGVATALHALIVG